MEQALGADGHGFLEHHDALAGLVAEELQGRESAGRRHVQMLPLPRWYDEAFRCRHVGVLPCGGMSMNVGPGNITVHESESAATARPSFGLIRALHWAARAVTRVINPMIGEGRFMDYLLPIA